MRHRFLSGWLETASGSSTLPWVVLATFSAVAFLNVSFVRAEEAPKAAAAEAEKPAATEGGEEMEPFGGAEKPPAGEKAPTGGQAPAGKKQEEPDTYLEWMAKALGWFYSIVFLALSFTLVALLVMNLLTARREAVCPVGLVESFETHLNNKAYQDAYDLAKNDESFLGRVLEAGLAKLSRGYQPAIEAMQEVGEEENMKLEHRLSYMALIGTISPMVGLLGTVQGMISSFSVIASMESTPPPSQLAGGISTALFTTLVGLFIAIPAIAVYNILRNRVARLVLDVGIVSEGLMSRFSVAGAKQP
jgi:biopolymer transport protein ExbB